MTGVRRRVSMALWTAAARPPDPSRSRRRRRAGAGPACGSGSRRGGHRPASLAHPPPPRAPVILTATKLAEHHPTQRRSDPPPRGSDGEPVDRVRPRKRRLEAAQQVLGSDGTRADVDAGTRQDSAGAEAATVATCPAATAQAWRYGRPMHRYAALLRGIAPSGRNMTNDKCAECWSGSGSRVWLRCWPAGTSCSAPPRQTTRVSSNASRTRSPVTSASRAGPSSAHTPN